MSEMVERKPGDPISEIGQRAQLALIQKFGPTGTWDRFMLGNMVLTVIAAMREPTDAMCMVGPAWNSPAAEIWRAMCDEALKE